VEELEKYLATARGKTRGDVVVINGGLSVSGLQHIGRLRGEVVTSEAVRKLLLKRGYAVKQFLVLYTQDAWKGKEPQLAAFKGKKEEAKAYTGWPLAKVPDPEGCHRNWVEHYWEDFGGYLDKFTDGDIEVVTTTELYKGPLKELVKEAIAKRESLRLVVNKYRGRNPYPEGWIPIEPVCEKCGRIDTTKALKYIPESEEVEYVCENCGHRGKTSITNGKLNWRIEWASIWKALGIDFEPYGKDHATPGGSRDSCVDISVNVLNNAPPLGLAYEWVSIRVGGAEYDMGSSDFIGMTPKEWYQIAHPEVLRFLYVREVPQRKVVIDPVQVPSYYDQFFRAESAYYRGISLGGIDKLSESEYQVAKAYELSLLEPPPESMPVQPPYLTIALAVQLVPKENLAENVIKRLRGSRILPENLGERDYRRLREMAWRARNWVERYAPDSVKFEVLAEVPESLKKSLKYRDYLVKMGEELEKLADNWSEDSIKQAMMRATSELSDEEKREFYREFYLVTLGRERGPRAAPLLEVLGPEFALKRYVKELSG